MPVPTKSGGILSHSGIRFPLSRGNEKLFGIIADFNIHLSYNV